MKAFETKDGLYNYKHLPALASFILEHDLDAYVKDQIALSYDLEVPILKLFEHLKEEEKYKEPPFKIVKVQSSIPSLTQFALNNGTSYKVLRIMNPWLRGKQLTVRNGKAYELKLPAGNS